jgi:hypothetical protein
MGNVWSRIDRLAPQMTNDERERRDAVRASWVNASQIAVFPTLDPDTIAARKERARQVAYAEIRERRRQAAARRVALSRARDAYHRLEGGGTV